MVSGTGGSFANEHTVEFAVVETARKAFRNYGASCIPVFYWKSREGGRASRLVNSGLLCHMAAIFPRRPKLYGEDLQSVFWKVGAELHNFARIADQWGVTTFGALPQARNLVELGSTPPIHWLRLGDAEQDSYFRPNDLPPGSSEESLCETVLSSPRHPWVHLDEAMSELRHANPWQRSWFTFSGYKPVYLLAVP